MFDNLSGLRIISVYCVIGKIESMSPIMYHGLVLKEDF